MRAMTGVYGFPIPVTQAPLDSALAFYLVATDMSLPAGYKSAEEWGRVLFPHHGALRMASAPMLFQRIDAPTSAPPARRR